MHFGFCSVLSQWTFPLSPLASLPSPHPASTHVSNGRCAVVQRVLPDTSARESALQVVAAFLGGVERGKRAVFHVQVRPHLPLATW